MQPAKKKLVYFLIIPLLISSCAGKFKGLELNESYLQDRQLQTRKFNTNDEKALLIASASVLQDMGFKIDESETKLGVISASKDRDATNPAQVAVKIIYLALLVNIPIDATQHIKASLVTQKSSNEGYLLRATFQRIITNDQGVQVRFETVKDEELYKGFFDKVSKSVFLEAQNI